MTNLEINQLLHERVVGECWHDADKRVGDSVHIPLQWFCTKCGDEVGYEGVYMPPLHPSYTSSWEAYGRLLEVAMMKEWWKEFAYDLNTDDFTYADYQFKEDIVLNTLRGSTALAEFVKERGI